MQTTKSNQTYSTIPKTKPNQHNQNKPNQTKLNQTKPNQQNQNKTKPKQSKLNLTMTKSNQNGKLSSHSEISSILNQNLWTESYLTS